MSVRVSYATTWLLRWLCDDHIPWGVPVILCQAVRLRRWAWSVADTLSVLMRAKARIRKHWYLGFPFKCGMKRIWLCLTDYKVYPSGVCSGACRCFTWNIFLQNCIFWPGKRAGISV